MSFRILIATMVFALAASSQDKPVATDAHTRKLADIRKLMSLTGGDKMTDQIFDQMAQNLKASGGSDRMLQEFRKEFDFNKLLDITIAAYDKNMSDEDVRAIIRFYESPAGQRMLQAMPKIVAEMMAGSMEMSREMAEKVKKKLQQPE